MPVGSGDVPVGDAFEAATDVSPASEDGVEHEEQILMKAWFVHVAVCTPPEGLLDYIERRFVGNEEHSGIRDGRTDTADDLETIQRRQADVEQDHVRLSRFSLMDSVESIRGFADNQHVGALLEESTERLTEQLVIFNNENFVHWHQRARIHGITRSLYADLARPSLRGNPSYVISRRPLRSRYVQSTRAGVTTFMTRPRRMTKVRHRAAASCDRRNAQAADSSACPGTAFVFSVFALLCALERESVLSSSFPCSLPERWR